MYNVHLLTTNDRILPPPNLGANFTWERLTDTLRRDLGDEAADLLAEPVQDGERKETRWYVQAETDPVPVSGLSPSERETVFRRLSEVRSRIETYAEGLDKAGGETNARLAAALRAAIHVPDEQTHVWSLDGKPILAAWGRKVETVIRADPVISRPAGALRGEAAGSGLNLAVVGAAGAGEPGPAAYTWGSVLLSSILWLSFIAAALLIGYKLLPACGVDLPIIGRFLDTCPQFTTAPLEALQDKNQVLRALHEKTEADLALKQVDCQVRESRLLQTAAARTEGPAGETPGVEETGSRVEAAQGSHGQLEIALSWNGHADLDLYVLCPGGKLYHGARAACGGAFDIDQNSTTLVDKPVEHAFWTGTPPAGRYRVEVKLYSWRDAPKSPVTFTVVVRDGEKETGYSGEVKASGEQITVVEFDR